MVQNTKASPSPEGNNRQVKPLAEFSRDWMIPRRISVRDHGSCNVLIVVPCGFPGDATNYEILGYHIAETLDACAVINNRKYVKPSNEDTEAGFIADLGDQADAISFRSDYLDPIFRHVRQIHERSGQTPMVLVLNKFEGKRHAKDHVSKGSGELAKQAQDVDLPGLSQDDLEIPVKVFQYEFRGIGFTDTEENCSKAAAMRADVVTRDPAFHRWSPEAVQNIGAGSSQQKVEIVEPDHEEHDDDMVEAAVSFINEKLQETVYRGSEQIGAYLLDTFFDGDVKRASSRNPKKGTSFRKLCQRDDLLVSPAALSIMVRVAAQEKFFVEKEFDSSSLSYRHKSELVKMPNDDEKLRLAKEAIRAGLPSRALAERVKGLRPGQAQRQTELLTILDKFVENPVRLFESPEQTEAILQDENLKEIPVEQRHRLHSAAFNMLDQLNEWAKTYRKLVKKLEKLDEKEGGGRRR